MEHTKNTSGLEADLQTVLDHLSSGQPLDPEIARRVREHGQSIRREAFKKHGVLDIGVPAIRELRGALPDA